MKKNRTIEVFFALVRAGLWSDGNQEIRIDGTTDWNEVYRLATEQSVLGLVLAGLECSDIKPPKESLLQWIGEVQLIEQRNKAMNVYIAELIEEMRSDGIYTLLVKGQGLAQCYNRPNWRSSGDVDLLLSKDNYEKAKAFILPKGVLTEPEEAEKKHLAMQVGQWAVELHGTLRVGLSVRVDRMLDNVQHEIFYGGRVRSWVNGQTQVFLPAATEDVVYVFAHILQHFYKGGIGLRQICDWCRLLYTYRDSLDYGLLEQRIKSAGLMSEWKAFGALAIEYLGFPKDAMPLLDVRSKKEDVRWRKKADRIMEFILKSGNMGHKRGSWLMEHDSWLSRQYVVRKAFSMFRRISDLINHARIFPLDSLRFFPRIMFNGIVSAVRGE